MRWQIEKFIFCERQQTLTDEGQVVQLEPMVVELLAYFCRHPDQVISRDQLIEHVWLGRVITDNAVSKVITKLRKVLADSSKQPQFIATYPKKGYKFIATVSRVVEEQVAAAESNTDDQWVAAVKANKGYSFTRSFSLLMAFIVLLAIAMIWQSNTQPLSFSQVQALTRDPGVESKAQVSPDGQYLAYVEVHDKKMRQWIKSLADETKIEVSHGESESTWVDSVSWNSDGSLIVYLVTTPDSCQYFIREFKQMSLGEPRLIHNCPAGSYGKIRYTHDDNVLIYSENEGRNTAFRLYELNLTTGAKRKLNQPEVFLGGNSQFDLHPTENKLLISSPDKQQWEGFYSLDLETDRLKLLFKQDAYICCGIWDHSGERVILMGEHPATELVSYDLQGKDRQVIYASSEQVRAPERHVNGKDYLFPIAQLNQNAHYFDFSTKLKSDIAASSVDDRLATFAYHNDSIAYVGLSSGNEEIWLTDPAGQSRKKLTRFNDSRHYIELLWSYDGAYLLGLTLNEIHLINSKTGEFETLKIPQVELRGVSWKDEETIAYSMQTSDGWRVNYYNINSHQVAPEKESWQTIRYTLNPDDTLWLDQQGKLFVGKAKIAVTDSELNNVDFLPGRTFNLKKVGQRWAWQQWDKGRYQLMLKSHLNAPMEVLLESDSYHFELSTKGILYHTVESLGADIYQTVSLSL